MQSGLNKAGCEGDGVTRSVRGMAAPVWFGIALIVSLALGRLWWLPAHASHNINEGWNAGHLARAWGPGLLYPAPDALIANNYPPLSFWLIGLVQPLVGDSIIAGRLVSLASEAAVGAVTFLLVRRLTGARDWAVAGALFFAGFAVTLLRGYLAMNDPQWLAQALMAGALVLLVPRAASERPMPGRVAAAAVLTVAGGLVKHNLVAVPIAVTLWLFVAERRSFLIWAITGTALVTAACAALFAIWGRDVFLDVLGPARSYSALRMAAHGVPLLLLAAPGLLAARPLLDHWREDPRRLLPLFLLAVAIPTAILQRSGDGVDINATFETVVALAIAVPVGCSLRAERPGRWFALALLPACALVPVALLADARELTGRGAAERDWRPFIQRIAAARGPVACDDQALCHWAGRRSALDFFAMKQRLLKGDVPTLRIALDRHAFALIAMRGDNPGWHENRLIPAIHARYRVTYVAHGYELLVPR